MSTDVLQTKGVADWEITISEIAEREGNLDSESETLIAVFEAEALLTDSEQVPVTTLESFDFVILGGVSGTRSEWTGEGCGRGDFDESLLLDIGDAVTGSVCVEIPSVDLYAPNTIVAITFNLDEEVYFGEATPAA